MSSKLVVRGLIVTTLWLLGAALYARYTIATTSIPHAIFEPAIFGVVLLAILSPIAVVWLTLFHYDQTRVLREQLTRHRQAVILQIGVLLRREYTQTRYLGHGTAITKFKDQCKNDDYWVVFRRKMRSTDEDDRREVYPVDRARRAFSDYFDTVLLLGDKELVTQVLKKSAVDFLRDTIWKLEIARDENFERTRFDRLWELYNLTRPLDPNFPQSDNANSV